MNQFEFHISFNSGLNLRPTEYMMGIKSPIEIWHKYRFQIDAKIIQTTFQGGFFMPKNEMQLTE